MVTKKNKMKGVSEKIEKFSRASLNYNQNDFNVRLELKEIDLSIGLIKTVHPIKLI